MSRPSTAPPKRNQFLKHLLLTLYSQHRTAPFRHSGHYHGQCQGKLEDADVSIHAVELEENRQAQTE